MEFLGRRLTMSAKAVRALAEARMAEAGASLSAAIIVRILCAEPGLSQRDLAKRMGVEGPTLVRHLDNLEANGMVTRTRDCDDRRVVRVRATPAGCALSEELSGVSASTHRELTAVFSTAELRRFEEYLERVKQHAEAALRDTSIRNSANTSIDNPASTGTPDLRTHA